MKKLLSILTVIIASHSASSQCSDLFFSEYIEGSGNNKALEIYNPTSSTIDLSDYKIHRNANGSATSSSNTVLSGMLAPNSVFVATNSSATDANIIAQSDITSGVTSFNGDDAVWLQKISTGDTLDIIGEIGFDPGSNWVVDTGSTANYTLIRKIGIQTGQIDWTLGASEWDVYAQNMTDSLGMHSMTSCNSSCAPTYSSISIDACDSYTVTNGTTYNTTGTYYDTLTNNAGCDSVITISLQINNSTYGSELVVECDSFTWTDGITYTSSTNTPTDTLVNSNGCDSIVTLDLTINYSSTGIDHVISCYPITWIDGITYSSSNNTATHTITSPNGCDSIITLNLIVYEYADTFQIDTIVSCGPYTWIDGITYSASNDTASIVYTSLPGCDSVITLNLTVIEIDTSVNSAGGAYTSNQNNATYQWVDCNNNYAIVPGETNQTYMLSAGPGNFAVVITYMGCADTSACQTIIMWSVEENNPFSKVNIYPNPSNGPIAIDLEGINSVDLSLVDIAGKQILEVKNVSKSNYELNNNLPSGVYFLTLKAEGHEQTFKVVVK